MTILMYHSVYCYFLFVFHTCKFCEFTPISFVVIILTKIWKFPVLNGDITKWRIIMSHDCSTYCQFLFCNDFAGRFALTVFKCLSFSVICDCGISWSYSLVFNVYALKDRDSFKGNILTVLVL